VIFRPELARLIRAGRKTQTRRPARVEPVCRYQPGKTYAVQPGRGQFAVCRIHVTTVRKELAGEIAFADARQEGFATTEEFKAAWVAIHDKAWLEHEHAMLDEAELDDGQVLDRDVWIMRRSLDMFEQRHAHKPVWVVSFRVHVEEEVRLLALRSDEIYVTSAAQAMRHEPEAVDADTQRAITGRSGTVQRQWGSLEQARRDRDRALLSREDQIVRLRRAARLRSVDASRELWALQNMLPSAADDRFVAKVRKTEAKVFRAAA
jgi:uncharacterized protein YqfB (UPF0267 family)